MLAVSGEEEVGSWGVGVVHPMMATIPAWWVTLNSRPPFFSAWESELEFQSSGGCQYGRRCGTGVLEMTTLDHGIFAWRWMKVYFKSELASDMYLSAGRRNRVTASWSEKVSSSSSGREYGCLGVEGMRGRVSM